MHRWLLHLKKTDIVSCISHGFWERFDHLCALCFYDLAAGWGSHIAFTTANEMSAFYFMARVWRSVSFISCFALTNLDMLQSTALCSQSGGVLHRTGSPLQTLCWDLASSECSDPSKFWLNQDLFKSSCCWSMTKQPWEQLSWDVLQSNSTFMNTAREQREDVKRKNE